MADLSLDDFLDRLATVESTGNPNAHNASGASGLFQIMPNNWPVWAKAAGVNPADRSPAAQRKVAAHQVQQYYNRYHDWRAVAVAWYAGGSAADAWVKDSSQHRFNMGQSQGAPSINQYAYRVLNATPDPKQTYGREVTPGLNVSGLLPQGGGGGTSGGAGAPTAGLGASGGGSDDAALMNAYGYAAHLADIPELKSILDQAVAQHWGADQIDAAVRNSDWARQHNDAQVNWEMEKRLHPKQAQDDLNALKVKLHDQAIKDGFPLPQDRLDALAEHIKSGGFDDTQSAYALHAEYQFKPGQAPQGQAADTIAQLRAQAKAYLVPISDAALQDWTMRMIFGSDTAGSFDQYLRDQAKSMFPQFSASIDAGAKPVTLLDPYKQLAANELNISPETIDFTDPKWSGVLMTTDAKTGARTMPNLDQWRTTLRTDPKYGWANTTNAQNMAADFGESLLHNMGSVA